MHTARPIGEEYVYKKEFFRTQPGSRRGRESAKGFGSAVGGRARRGSSRELVEGNRRFVAGHPVHPNSSLARAKKVGKEGQHPHSAVLCCADSRVPPEILFDQGIGDLFVIRVAGNVANGDETGSIEYAVEHLGVTLCVKYLATQPCVMEL